MERLVLYFTPDCHLCEAAQELIRNVLGVPVAEVDIAADERLLELYGVHIPVLRRLDIGVEIGWPFGPSEIQALLNAE